MWTQRGYRGDPKKAFDKKYNNDDGYLGPSEERACPSYATKTATIGMYIIRRLKKYKESVNTKKVLSKLARNTSNPRHSPAATAMPNRSNICEQNRCYGQHKIMCIGPKTIHVSVGRTSSAWISPYRHEWFKVGLDNMIKKKI